MLITGTEATQTKTETNHSISKAKAFNHSYNHHTIAASIGQQITTNETQTNHSHKLSPTLPSSHSSLAYFHDAYYASTTPLCPSFCPVLLCAMCAMLLLSLICVC